MVKVVVVVKAQVEVEDVVVEAQVEVEGGDDGEVARRVQRKLQSLLKKTQRGQGRGRGKGTRTAYDLPEKW